MTFLRRELDRGEFSFEGAVGETLGVALLRRQSVGLSSAASTRSLAPAQLTITIFAGDTVSLSKVLRRDSRQLNPIGNGIGSLPMGVFVPTGF